MLFMSETGTTQAQAATYPHKVVPPHCPLTRRKDICGFATSDETQVSNCVCVRRAMVVNPRNGADTHRRHAINFKEGQSPGLVTS